MNSLTRKFGPDMFMQGSQEGKYVLLALNNVLSLDSEEVGTGTSCWIPFQAMNALADRTLWKLVEDIAPAEPPKANKSVSLVFGENLRLLTSLKGTQVRVAGDLDIARVQFQRYLRGESFPKPNLLKKICTYFGVDARILTEPLTGPLAKEMLLSARSSGTFQYHREWMNAISYAAPEHNYFHPNRALENGLYATWVNSETRRDMIMRVLVRVMDHDGVKVLRGYAPREAFDAGTPASAREFRGICLSMRQGYVFLNFHPKPSEIMSCAFVSHVNLSDRYPDVLIGYNAVSRDELPGVPRLSRIVFEPIQPGPGVLVKQAHMPSLFAPDEVPQAIGNLLSMPVA